MKRSFYYPELSGKSILVVDDSSDIRRLFKLVLQAAKCRVDIAFDGINALDLVSKRDYDLILMDILMPRMDGNTCVSTLRRCGYHRPVIAISGDCEDSVSNLFNKCLIKPVNIVTLLDTVSKTVLE